ATIIAERLGAIAGALVATLPVSAGPVYVFLALDHDAAFISASAAASLALNAATAIFLTTYVLIAQRHSLWLSVSVAFVVWLTTTLPLSAFHWTAFRAFVLNLVVFASCFFIVRPFSHVRMPTTTQAWYDLVIRAGMVTVLVGVIVALSFKIGAEGSGVLAVFPVIYASIMLILHRRIGGPATAAVLANAISGLAGFGAALLTLHLTAEALGSALALVLALGVSVAWNAAIYGVRRHHRLLPEDCPGISNARAQLAFRRALLSVGPREWFSRAMRALSLKGAPGRRSSTIHRETCQCSMASTSPCILKTHRCAHFERRQAVLQPLLVAPSGVGLA